MVHRWYFSPETLKILLKKAGFEDFQFCERVLRPDWCGHVEYAGPSRRQLVEKILKNPLHSVKSLSQFLELKKAQHWEMPGSRNFYCCYFKIEFIWVT